MKNKQLLNRLLAFSAVATLGATSLTGCSNTINYEYSSETNIVATGPMEYNKLKNAKLVRLKNKIEELDEYYLVLSYHHTFNGNISKKLYYVDIETGETIYSEQDKDYKKFTIEIILDNLVDHLYKYNLVQDEYNIDDIETIKQKLLEDETIINKKSISKKLTLKRHYC